MSNHPPPSAHWIRTCGSILAHLGALARKRRIDSFQFLTPFVVLLLILQFISPAWAASFDCRKATTDVEKIICAREELSQLDDQLANTYKNALKAVAEPAVLKADQREWLEKRNRCTGMSCLYDAYVQRVTQLFYYSQRDSEGNNSYKLVDDSCESESDAGKIRCGVCRDYLAVLNSLSEPVRCDMPTNQDIGFDLVEMKPLDPWAYPQMLYALDTFQYPNDTSELPGTKGITRFKDMNFEQWLLAYKQKMASPIFTITPTLAEANMRINRTATHKGSGTRLLSAVCFTVRWGGYLSRIVR